MKTAVVLVGGTWGGDWTRATDPFFQFLQAQGFDGLPFEGWSGDVDGIPGDLGKNGKHSDWIAGGFALAYFLRSMPYEDRNVIAHSHGGQVAAYCADRTRIQIRNLITVCTPVRNDMDAPYAALRSVTGRWRHVSAAGWDFWQRAGELADGHFGWTRTMRHAHQNDLYKGIGHSKILSDPAQFHHWTEGGLFDTLRADPAVTHV